MNDELTDEYTLSDRSTKDNITLIPDALDKVKALTGNTFTWKVKPSPDSERLGTQDVGVIAQEVEALGLSPNLIFLREDGTKHVSYKRLIPVLIEAIKELSDKNDALQTRITTLEGS